MGRQIAAGPRLRPRPGPRPPGRQAGQPALRRARTARRRRLRPGPGPGRGQLDGAGRRRARHRPLRRPRAGPGPSVDARSDVYSLALVLVEAVTGTVPFAADTSLATLLARVERHLEVPAELGALGPVLERAGRADPADRFPDARAFAAALSEAAAPPARPRPDPLPGPGAGRVRPPPDRDRPAGVRPAPAPARPGAVPCRQPTSAAGPDHGRERLPSRRRAGPAARGHPGASSRPRPPGPGAAGGVARPQRLVPIVVLAVLLLAAGTAAFAAAAAAGPRARVPNLVGPASRRPRRRQAGRRRRATSAPSRPTTRPAPWSARPPAPAHSSPPTTR